MAMGKRNAATAIRRFSQEVQQYGVPPWFEDATRHLADWRQVGGFLLVVGGALVGLDQWALGKHIDAGVQSIRADLKVSDAKIDFIYKGLSDLTKKVEELRLK